LILTPMSHFSGAASRIYEGNRTGTSNASPPGMPLSMADFRAARMLHGWLRRTALAAIPMVALSGCNDCTQTPGSFGGLVPPDAGWMAGSTHTAVECRSACVTVNTCSTWAVDHCVVAEAGNSVSCFGTETRCYEGPCGRFPAGFRRAGLDFWTSSIARELSAAAHLEGAAVFAFEALERELVAHGAPPGLVSRARRAQADERRHHRSMSRLARRSGGIVPSVEVDPVPVRTLFEVALENAVEGCVRESYGAAVAAYQGEWATDPAVRRTMRAIAVDEAEHASLGWAVDRWARSRLPSAAHLEIDEAAERARATIRENTQREVARAVAVPLGLPDPAAAAVLNAAVDEWFGAGSLP
jgi:hypothetical protein